MSIKERTDTVAFLREFVERHPEDAGARLRLGSLLAGRGERAAARAVLLPLEEAEPPIGAQATAELAALDEEDGRRADAIARWERLLADDIDHPEARAHLARLRGGERPRAEAPAASPPTLASPEGVKLLRYELIREIGRGATSTVYLARDQALGIELALKVLHPQLAASERSEACRRFFEEARVVATLRHPGVVAIYDLDEAARTLVMEYLPGGTLRDRLRATPALAVAEVRATAAGLLAALAYLHLRGVVHGDITPRNVLLRRPGAPVLADFGNARLGVASATDRPAGTPIYLAPEQFRGAPPSPATDLFAVGAVLWEALAGRPMRRHADLVADRLAPLPLPEAARPDGPLAALVEALTAATPEERPPEATAALALLGGSAGPP